MDERPAHFHRKRERRSRGLRQPERRIKAKRKQLERRISSSYTFMSNRSLTNKAEIKTKFDILSRLQKCFSKQMLLCSTRFDRPGPEEV
ncbi:unnamed protein product [Protopolystoma xenopodis]|uniref:Uncharacterized protein n=1 Tax=Protopolystoma xenopodis TaxID=117903 RepID=A0A448XEC4_9PLAT|nr:unnamed protein product [Protopolystoma xenopodis]